jgi:hypothetical protein
MKCYQVRIGDFNNEKMRKFRIFWKIWKKIVFVKTYNKNTVRAFFELINEDKTKVIELINERQYRRIARNMNIIIEFINYSERLKYTIEGYRKGIWLMIMRNVQLYQDDERNIEDKYMK